MKKREYTEIPRELFDEIKRLSDHDYTLTQVYGTVRSLLASGGGPAYVKLPNSCKSWIGKEVLVTLADPKDHLERARRLRDRWEAKNEK